MSFIHLASVEKIIIHRFVLIYSPITTTKLQLKIFKLITKRYMIRLRKVIFKVLTPLHFLKVNTILIM